MRQIGFAMTCLIGLAACSDPLGGLPRFSDVQANEPTATVAAAPSEVEPARGGLFARLLNRAPEDPTNAAVEAALADAGAIETRPDSADDLTAAASLQPSEAGTTTGGLFGIFRRQPQTPSAEAADPTPEVTQASATVAPQDTASPRRGLAGLFRRAPGADVPRNGPDTSDVEAGASLPFGQVARVCGMQRRQLGTEIEGGGGFKLYDSNPASTAPRPFYITGFSDNCARTFTGAVVISGDIRSHEFVRYQPSNERISYTPTDNAYEAIKASVCRVGRGQPCGDRTDRLNRTTRFITVYDFFGGTFSAVPTKWTQILLHDGEVVAVSIKNG